MNDSSVEFLVGIATFDGTAKLLKHEFIVNITEHNKSIVKQELLNAMDISKHKAEPKGICSIEILKLRMRFNGHRYIKCMRIRVSESMVKEFERMVQADNEHLLQMIIDKGIHDPYLK